MQVLLNLPFRIVTFAGCGVLSLHGLPVSTFSILQSIKEVTVVFALKSLFNCLKCYLTYCLLVCFLLLTTTYSLCFVIEGYLLLYPMPSLLCANVQRILFTPLLQEKTRVGQVGISHLNYFGQC